MNIFFSLYFNKIRRLWEGEGSANSGFSNNKKKEFSDCGGKLAA
jgi:hypothetical protein